MGAVDGDEARGQEEGYDGDAGTDQIMEAGEFLSFSLSCPKLIIPTERTRTRMEEVAQAAVVLKQFFLVLFVQHICRRIIVFVPRRLTDGIWAKKRNYSQYPWLYYYMYKSIRNGLIS